MHRHLALIFGVWVCILASKHTGELGFALALTGGLLLTLYDLIIRKQRNGRPE